jgi:plastocyanin
MIIRITIGLLGILGILSLAATVGIFSYTSPVLAQQNLTSTQTSTAGTQVSIVQGASTMADKAFSPNPVTVKVGDTITWTNNDNQFHTVTSGIGSSDPNMGKAFDSGLSGPSALTTMGKIFHHQFTQAGQYPYFCQLHPMMVGKVIVS